MKKILPTLLTCAALSLSQVSYAAVPTAVNYQGYLTDTSGSPINNNAVSVTFLLYDVSAGGVAVWSETQVVDVSKGLFNVKLGDVTPFSVGLFDVPMWLGIKVGTDAEMSPRSTLSSVGYALKAEDADTLNGLIATDLDQSSHVGDTSNPHNVVIGQIAGAVSTSDLSSHSANANAHHTKYTNAEATNAMGAKANNNALNHDKTTSLPWNSISSKPAGFADGIDNDSGGDITGVSAGTGLNGGGLSGNATLNVNVPLNLSAINSGVATVFSHNTSSTAGSSGVKGESINGPTRGFLGVQGSTDFNGIAEIDNAGSEIGVLGLSTGASTTDNYGLYGYSNGTGLYAEGINLAAKFVGDIDVSGQFVSNMGIGTPPSSNMLDVRRGQSSYLVHMLNDNNLNGSGSAYGITVKGDAYNTGSGQGRGGYFEGKGGINGGNAYGSMGYAFAYGSSRAYGVYSFATGGTTTGKEYAFYGIGMGYFSQDLGIGTNSPEARLHVYSSGSSSDDATLLDGSGVFLIGRESGTNIIMDNNEIMARNNGAPSKLYLNKDSTHVVVPGLEITGGADIAEPFNVSEQYKVLPGMVMAIDSENPGKLRVAKNSYDHTVAGIVSGANGINPGVSLTQAGVEETHGSTLIALTGRLYALADAKYGEIKPGDLLTTSDTLGHVMKVSDYSKAHGAIIGKAMTSLKAGKGHILVLVSLQ